LPGGPSRCSDEVTPCRFPGTRGPSGLDSPSESSPVTQVFRPPSLGFVRTNRIVRSRLAPSARLARPKTGHPSSPGVRMPLHRHAFERPLPHASPRASVTREPPSPSRSVLVVSHHLDGFLRSEVAGLSHPAASPGVRRVSAVWRPRLHHPKAVSRGTSTTSPRRVSHPSKNSPRVQPHHVAVAVAPLPFLRIVLCARHRSRCQFRCFTHCLFQTPTSRRCSALGSVTFGGRFQPPCVLSFLGFVPLQGPSERALPRAACADLSLGSP
jgi:hypothetical protein